jgi:hypothetical protein
VAPASPAFKYSSTARHFGQCVNPHILKEQLAKRDSFDPFCDCPGTGLRHQRLITPHSASSNSCPLMIPISERMLQLLMVRCSDKREGWLFPSPRAKCGHLTTVAKQFREARSKAGLPESLVLYCARHTFGTAAYGATGNLAMVMNVMGHSDVRTAMRYQHPVLDPVREAIDQRNLHHKPRHNELRVQ